MPKIPSAMLLMLRSQYIHPWCKHCARSPSRLHISIENLKRRPPFVLFTSLEQDSKACKDASSHNTKPVDLSEVDDDTGCARRAVTSTGGGAATAATA